MNFSLCIFVFLLTLSCPLQNCSIRFMLSCQLDFSTQYYIIMRGVKTILSVLFLLLCISGQNFYRQTTVEFIRYDVCWFKTWCTGIFLWWQKFYIGIIVWDIKCGTVWENTVSVDFKHGVCGYFYGENLSRQ